MGMVGASQCGSQSAVALGAATSRCASWLTCLFHRQWCTTAPAKLHKKALHEAVASQSQAPLMPSTAGAPCGFMQHFLCKIAYAGPGVSVAGALRSVPALRAANCRPGAVLALWLWSVASQVFLVSGLRPCILCLPRPPWGLATLRVALALRGLPVRPRGDSLRTALGHAG
jgi:hypothetical protein